MGKLKPDKPKIRVSASLGLFYLAIENPTNKTRLVGPFKTADDAEIERKKQKKLLKKAFQFTSHKA